MEVILFNITLTCIIVIAFNLFVIELNDDINIEVLVALTNMSVMVGLTFIYFYLAERITTDLLAIGEIFYNSAWDRLPANYQKLLVLPIQRTEREVRLTGLGMFSCSLFTFSSVPINIS